MPYFPPPMEQAAAGNAATPVKIGSAERYEVPEDSQVIFRKRIRIENGGRLAFDNNSILVETT